MAAQAQAANIRGNDASAPLLISAVAGPKIFPSHDGNTRFGVAHTLALLRGAHPVPGAAVRPSGPLPRRLFSGGSLAKNPPSQLRHPSKTLSSVLSMAGPSLNGNISPGRTSPLQTSRNKFVKGRASSLSPQPVSQPASSSSPTPPANPSAPQPLRVPAKPALQAYPSDASYGPELVLHQPGEAPAAVQAVKVIAMNGDVMVLKNVRTFPSTALWSPGGLQPSHVQQPGGAPSSTVSLAVASKKQKVSADTSFNSLLREQQLQDSGLSLHPDLSSKPDLPSKPGLISSKSNMQTAMVAGSHLLPPRSLPSSYGQAVAQLGSKPSGEAQVKFFTSSMKFPWVVLSMPWLVLLLLWVAWSSRETVQVVSF